MEPIIEACCGLDVHQATVVACLIVGPAHSRPRKTVRTFRTVMRDLVALRDWLLADRCTHVGMESTGVYWKPVYAILEGHFELIVGNAEHIRNVPGRKTDVRDAEWIADLVRHGLIAASFVPPKPIRELRDLMRYRRKLVEARSAERNRLLKLLEGANIKLASVASNVFGVSGMCMLKALLAGAQTPTEMAELAKGRLRRKRDDLVLALDGRLEEHHCFLLHLQLQRLERFDADLSALEAHIEERLVPYAAQRALLMQIPGIDRTVAAVIIAELGVDMTLFHGPRHLAAWTGLCPGNNESAGKRKRQSVRKGNVYLQSALVEAATAASRKKGTYLRDKFLRLRSRRGHQRAAVAVAHKMLIAIYHVLLHGSPYKDLGEGYLDHLAKSRVAHNLVHRLRKLGYEVEIKQPAA